MYARQRGGKPEVPSITTVLDVLNQNMEWWEARCAVEQAYMWSERLVALKQRNPHWSEERDAKNWLEGAAERDRDEASRRGDLVHDYAEAWALFKMGVVGNAEVQAHWAKCAEGGALDYLTSFHQFWDDFKPVPIQAEATVWNETVGYAGTTDLFCELQVDGRSTIAVMDWKTKRALYKRNGRPKASDIRDYTGMQLAAAALAEEIWLPSPDGQSDTWVPFPYEPEVGLAVALAPDGYAIRQFDIYHPLTWKTFVALREAWDFTRDGPSLMSHRLPGPSAIRPMTPRPSRTVGVSW